MFSHRKIDSKIVDIEYNKIRRTIKPDVAYMAAEVVGAYSATDMLEFANLDRYDINRVYIKARDGLPMASGMKKILPEADFVYITTKRYGIHKENVEIKPLFTKMEPHEDVVTWFADPINARGTTVIEVLRYLRETIPYEVALLSHIVANQTGIGKVQTQITDYNSSCYMNYAFLSKMINEETGFLMDALEVIPDFGDKVFGTIGEDYSAFQMQDDFNRLIGTNIGDIEIIKGIIIYILQRHESYKYNGDRNVGWATEQWIKETIVWYINERKLPVNIDIQLHLKYILDELNERGFVDYKRYQYKTGYAHDYYVTEEGVQISSAAYLPVLDKLGIIKIILRDLNFLVHKTAREIREHTNRHR